MKYEPHPLSEGIPPIEGKDFDALVKSIKERGLIDPITLYEGAILDGCNRYRACLEAGVEPRTTKFNGHNPEMYVLDRNLHRRHLTNAQKRQMAEKILKLSPERSNRHIAVQLKTDDHTIASVRNELEAAAEIPQLGKRVNQHGRRRSKTPGSGIKRGTITVKRKLGIFNRALSLFCNYAEGLEEIPIPHLEDAVRKDAEHRIKEAQRLIWKFRNRVKSEGTGK